MILMNFNNEEISLEVEQITRDNINSNRYDFMLRSLVLFAKKDGEVHQVFISYYRRSFYINFLYGILQYKILTKINEKDLRKFAEFNNN